MLNYQNDKDWKNIYENLKIIEAEWAEILPEDSPRREEEIDCPTIDQVKTVLAEIPGKEGGSEWISLIETTNGQFALVYGGACGCDVHDSSIDPKDWVCFFTGGVIIHDDLDILWGYLTEREHIETSVHEFEKLAPKGALTGEEAA